MPDQELMAALETALDTNQEGGVDLLKQALARVSQCNAYVRAEVLERLKFRPRRSLAIGWLLNAVDADGFAVRYCLNRLDAFCGSAPAVMVSDLTISDPNAWSVLADHLMEVGQVDALFKLIQGQCREPQADVYHAADRVAEFIAHRGRSDERRAAYLAPDPKMMQAVKKGFIESLRLSRDRESAVLLLALERFADYHMATAYSTAGKAMDTYYCFRADLLEILDVFLNRLYEFLNCGQEEIRTRAMRVIIAFGLDENEKRLEAVYARLELKSSFLKQLLREELARLKEATAK